MPDLHEYLPINLILNEFGASSGHIHHATYSYRHISPLYIVLQTLILVLRYAINRGDFHRSTTAIKVT